MTHPVRVPSLVAIVCSVAIVVACTSSPYPALDAITEEDLIRDVTALAHDDFLGREAGTVN